MSGSNREVEVKLRFDSPEDALKRLGSVGAVESTPRSFEDNILFDRAHDPLHQTRRALRLRRVGDRAVVTYKGPLEGDHRYKVRVEHETAVDDGDAAERILHALGYEPHWRYQKYRTEFSLGALHVCLDETPLGCFVELEGAPDEIDRAAERLGFSVDDYVTASYRKLLELEAGRQGRRPWDLLFEPEDATS
ncbi:MAG: class IV adenylate cyclase [Acidobacteria bacterium]|nr:class IV adenylate cyclase [Acidobacteriota bacterium]NIM62771.1 class IV adenylate cyclase [Acidobacteriota bacterium]NIO59071.1 class IV adenylate cyclase [Acidobacteriota bacterium]NIQ30110.1 class IV adenylate cyclase [Acidobacteriota bacterium]NIQ84913.1 class IV adenylate cyclase [Acidobacteriota bacterium]